MTRLIFFFMAMILSVSVSCSHPSVIRDGREMPYEEAAESDYQTIKQFTDANNDDGALKSIDTFERNFPESRLLSRVLYSKGEILYRHGKYDAASREFERAATKSTDYALKNHALYNQAVSLYHITRYKDAAEILSKINDKYVEPEVREKIVSLRRHIAPYIKDVEQTYASADHPVARSTIGVILPLSGKYEKYGRRSLQGIQLAANIFGNESTVSLAILDSRGEPEAAKKAVDELLSRDNVIAIIGPLLSATSESAVQRAQMQRVPIITLTQKEGITNGRSYVFRNTMINSVQARELAKYAIEERGLKRFAILFPRDSYGVELARFFWEDVKKLGGEVVAIEEYKPRQTDFRNEIKRLVGTDDVSARIDEWNALKEAMELEQGHEVNPKEVKLKPRIEFDALFIPDYTKTVGQIAPYLAYEDVKGVVLLGANGWNSPDLVRRAGEHVEGAIFVDGWFPDSKYPFVQEFYQSYIEAFREDPDILAAHGYDAASLLIEILKNGRVRSRDDLRDAIYRVKNFPGVSGVISFTDEGEADKQLYLLTVKSGKILSLK